MAATRGAPPAYTCTQPDGPSHLPVFTFICKYKEFEEEGRGSCKKQAKNLAAQKMFERVSAESIVVVPQHEMKSYLQTVSDSVTQLKLYEDNQALMIKANEKALEHHSQLSKTKVIKNTTNNTSYNDCYAFLRDAFSPSQRETVINKLQDTINACGEFISNKQIIDPMNLLQEALNILNINSEKVNYDIKQSSSDKNRVYGLKLNTNPTISEIGCGRNDKEAKTLAIFHVAQTLSLMLL